MSVANSDCVRSFLSTVLLEPGFAAESLISAYLLQCELNADSDETDVSGRGGARLWPAEDLEMVPGDTTGKVSTTSLAVMR